MSFFLDDFVSTSVLDNLSLLEIKIQNVISKNTITNSVCSTLIGGGKKIRPTVLFLIAELISGNIDNNCLHAGISIEMIHCASLLHDDVIDDSNIRRGNHTAHSIWGNQKTILSGDFLFAESFIQMVQTKNHSALEVISRVSSILTQGELRQLDRKMDLSLTEADYYDIIYAKTAALFEASAQIGSIFAGSRPSDCEMFAEFGKQIGFIFQIVDDYLDYFGESDQTKKNIGNDYIDGKLTLPIIYSMQNTKYTHQIRDIFGDRAQNKFTDLQNILTECDVSGYCKTVIQTHYNAAREIIERYESKYPKAKQSLLWLLDFCINRTF